MSDGATDLYGSYRIGKGLQQVDGLSVSEFAEGLILESINGGTYDYEKIDAAIYGYHSAEGIVDRQYEADIVANRITAYISGGAFMPSDDALCVIHKALFDGLLPNAGQYRTFDITKKEPVLGGRSVDYYPHGLIEEAVREEMAGFKDKRRVLLDRPQQVRKLTDMTTNLWEIHGFSEGNTRTVAVFIIKYLKSLGYEIDSAPFEGHSKYYRDALVRNCYMNEALGISYESKYLDMFYENLIAGGRHTLDRKDIVVKSLFRQEPETAAGSSQPSLDDECKDAKAAVQRESRPSLRENQVR
jgi:fido (protein-threonine AMPylation protein)